MGRPTQPMIDFATDLLEQLGYDPDNYDFDQMSYDKCSELIDELKDERGY